MRDDIDSNLLTLGRNQFYSWCAFAYCRVGLIQGLGGLEHNWDQRADDSVSWGQNSKADGANLDFAALDVL